MTEVLSIAIPTRNRAMYLKDLLDSIKTSLQLLGEDASLVKVYVYDNDSTDDTETVVDRAGFAIAYHKNAKDFGGDANIFKAYTLPTGEYIWVIGDDELLPKTSLQYVLPLIFDYRPGLIITKTDNYVTFVDLPLYFHNYQEYALFAKRNNPHLLLAHTLISATIIRRDCFDRDYAKNNITYAYGHSYGIARGLKRIEASVLCAEVSILIVRCIRAGDYSEAQLKTLDANQTRYLEWLLSEYHIDEITANEVVPTYQARLFWHNVRESPFCIMAWMTMIKHHYARLESKCRYFHPLLCLARRTYKIVCKIVASTVI
jgi:glycosyltransferase involved in cell wall biosynthesis